MRGSQNTRVASFSMWITGRPPPTQGQWVDSHHQEGYGHVAPVLPVGQVEPIGGWAAGTPGRNIIDIGVEIEVVAIELPGLALLCGAECVETPTDVVDQGVVFAQHPGRPLGIPQGCRRFPQHTIPLTV